MGLFDSKVKVKLPAATEAEQDVTQVAVGLAERQLAYARQQSAFTEYLFREMPELFEAVTAAGVLDEDVMGEELESLRSGVATPEQKQLISGVVTNALQLGEADIERFMQTGLEQVRDVLAPSRGLRPGDSPILGLGSDIAEEAQRQQAKLVSGLRGYEAETLLNLPFERGLPLAQLQAQLAQEAFNNRLRLAGTAGSLGLGMGPNVNVPAALSVIQQPRLAQTTTTSTPSIMDMISGGASAFTAAGGGLASVPGFLESGAGAVRSLFSGGQDLLSSGVESFKGLFS
jgi:hypothetical protein